MENPKLQFDTQTKALDQARWLTFSQRVKGTKYGVIEVEHEGYFVVPLLELDEREGIMYSQEDYSKMTFVEIENIRTDFNPLNHWEEICGIFSVANGELLRFILDAKVPLDKLIRYELSARGYDKDHQWCGFDKAREIWLQEIEADGETGS